MYMTTVETLELLESASGRLEKETLLRKNHADILLRDVFVSAYNPYITYGIKKWGKVPEGTSDDLAHFVYDLLPKLQARFLTGNVARREVEKELSILTHLAQKWAERILRKNLRVGVQVKTINKIWQDSITPFEVQLADKVTARTKDGAFIIDETLPYPLWVEPKFDGLRCIAIKDQGIVSLFTRNGTQLETLPGLQEAIASLPINNVVFDGEAMGSDWNESNSVLMSTKSRKDQQNITYHIFDIVNLEEWFKRECTDTFADRRITLQAVLSPEAVANAAQHFSLSLTPGVIVNNDGELYQTYVERLDEGHEGVMVKELDAPYAFKRGSNMKKLKPSTTYEGVVVGWYEGRLDTKRAGKVGGLEVMLANGVITRVGGGFSDLELREIEESGDHWSGRVVECEAQPPLTDDGKMRFPRYIRQRNINDVDSSLVELIEKLNE
ncbi:MAG: hypothetical protein WDA41_10220 [Candidatus Neomarinimicrobiota bacterium]